MRIIPLQESGQSSSSGDTFFFKREGPLEVRRRGIEMWLVVGGGADPATDPAILKPNLSMFRQLPGGMF
jgi:hypothetical protein